jgi:RecA-family ATPase
MKSDNQIMHESLKKIGVKPNIKIQNITEFGTNMADEIEKEECPTEWVYPELLLPRGTCCLVTAFGGTGKSLFMLDLAIRGTQRLGLFSNNNPPTKPIKTLFMDFETGLKRFTKRCKQLSNQYDNWPAENIRFLNPDQEQDGKFTFDNNYLRSIEENIKRLNIDVIVVDNLSKIVLDDMNSQLSSKILNNLRNFAQRTNTLIFVLHHAAKNERKNKDMLTAGSGTQAYTDAVDIKLVLTKEDDEIKVCTGKFNDYNPPSFSFSFENYGPIEPVIDRPMLLKIHYWKTRSKEENKTLEIIEFIKNNPATSARGIADSIGGNVKYVTDLIKNLIESGVLKKEGTKIIINET